MAASSEGSGAEVVRGRGRVVREGEEVTCTGSRWWLRARPAPDGGLHVEAAERVTGSWQRVDGDLTHLLRAGIRLRIADGAAAARFARRVSEVVGVRTVDPDPALAVVRATYPLLATGVGDRLPGVPAALPGHLQAAFRQPRPRDAARLLFGDRATRPVVRTFCTALAEREVPDLFALTVVAGLSPVLQPDHLAGLLERSLPTTSRRTDALTRHQMHTLARVVADVDPRRVVRLVAAALADDANRDRLRFVAQEHEPGAPTLADLDDWEELALHVALAAAGTDEVVA
jgi:hypothetical protein